LARFFDFACFSPFLVDFSLWYVLRFATVFKIVWFVIGCIFPKCC
jgi:hypothetical protein